MVDRNLSTISVGHCVKDQGRLYRLEYNPLYVWSGNRAGPLALLAATARSFREKHKLSNIAIVSAAEFAEDYIQALGKGVAGAWRERWWDVDLLLLYDAELISGAERAKDELFLLLEASGRKGTKILITADRAPSGVDDIDQRLRTRFEMGLVMEAPGKDLPKGAGELNLEEAPPEFIQDEDLWGGFMRPEVADTVLPPIEEFEAGDRSGLMPSFDDAATEAAPAEVAAPPAEAAKLAKVAEVAEAPEASEAAGTSSAWSPSKESVVWYWQMIEERIVEMTE